MLAGIFVVTACSQSESSTADTVDAPTSVVTTAPASTSAPTTEPPAITSAPTTEPPATTVAPDPTTTVADTPDDEGDGDGEAAAPTTALVTFEPDLVEFDLATGTVVREISEFFTGEGLFRGGFQICLLYTSPSPRDA